MKLVRTTFAAVAAAAAVSTVSIAKAQVADFVVYGGSGTYFDGAKTRGGAVGTNGDFTMRGGSEVHGLYALGSLLPADGGGSGDWFGPIVVNGSATIGGANIAGNVDVGGSLVTAAKQTGNVTVGGTTLVNFNAQIAGDVRSNGNYVQNAGTITGNVFTNGLASVGGTVNGNVTYRDAYQLKFASTVTGAVTQGTTAITPAMAAARFLPAATNFTSGGANVVTTNNVTLAPGSYGHLLMGVLNDLTLTGGNYYFDSFNFDGFDIHLTNVSANNPLHVYVTGDIIAGSLGNMTVNGLSLAQMATQHPEWANYITWETHGSLIENGGSNEWAGTLFAPNGNISLRYFTDVVGRVYAGGTVTMSGATLNVVPEPTTLAAVSSLAMLVLRRRRA